MEQLHSEKELARLIGLMCDGCLSAQDVRALQALLANSEDDRWTYIRAIHLLAGLQQWGRAQNCSVIRSFAELAASPYEHNAQGPNAANGVRTLINSLPEENSLAVNSDKVAQRSAPIVRELPLWLTPPLRWKSRLFAIAAVVALALSVKFLWQPSNGTPFSSDTTTQSTTLASGALSDSTTIVARVVSTTPDVTWAVGKRPTDFLMRLRPGDSLGAKTGRVTIEFCEGAFVVLHAPALLQVTSGDSARLVYGRIAGRAKHGNFVLLTPQATVVDIGTEFGVDVGKGNTDVVVFEGNVDVYGQVKAEHSSSMRLSRGMAVSIDPTGRATHLRSKEGLLYQRDYFRQDNREFRERSISLLDLINGNERYQRGIGGSIDPVSGYWGRVPWFESEEAKTRRGDTQFTQTEWNKFVDGVFIPRANAREMQINSDGQMVYLPPNSGTTWGPIWARWRSDFDPNPMPLISEQPNEWGGGSLASVRERLPQTRDGLVGFHANAGITFDLRAIRQAFSRQIEYLQSTIANLDSSGRVSPSKSGSVADFRVFVDGKLRYSRLGFGRKDGDSQMRVPLGKNDRFLTLVATDADGDPDCDHVVLADPVLMFQE